MKPGDKVKPSRAALRERLLVDTDRGVVVASTRGMQPHQIRVRSTWGGIHVEDGKVVTRERIVVWAKKWWRRA